MKNILIILFLFAPKCLIAQVIVSDTLNPYLLIKNSGNEPTTVIFNNTNISYQVLDKRIKKTINEAIKNKSALFVTHDTINYTISAVSIISSTSKEIFREKYDTLSFVNFEYNEKSTLKKNEKLFLEEFTHTLPMLKKEIPSDSLNFVFNFISSMSCENKTCNSVNPCISFEYKKDGCYARAHWMRKILAENFGYDCQKIFVYGSLKAINEGNCGKDCILWGYHVALLVQTRDLNENRIDYVIDPSLFNHAVSIQEWIAAQEKSCCNDCRKGSHDKYEIKPSYQYFPNGSTDNNYTNTKFILNKYCKKCH